jgi:hypothetical protein
VMPRSASWLKGSVCAIGELHAAMAARTRDVERRLEFVAAELGIVAETEFLGGAAAGEAGVADGVLVDLDRELAGGLEVVGEAGGEVLRVLRAAGTGLGEVISMRVLVDQPGAGQRIDRRAARSPC